MPDGPGWAAGMTGRQSFQRSSPPGSRGGGGGGGGGCCAWAAVGAAAWAAVMGAQGLTCGDDGRVSAGGGAGSNQAAVGSSPEGPCHAGLILGSSVQLPFTQALFNKSTLKHAILPKQTPPNA